MFITLEGGEGSGKSTQAALLADKIAASGRAVLRTREPGGAPGAEALREILLEGRIKWSAAAETHLHFAARAEHLERTILPALAAGSIVVCDRYADSTMAYQGYGLGADRALIAGLTKLLPVMPAVTILLTIDPQTGTDRIARRAGRADRYEAMDDAFHQRVADGYAALAAAEPDRFVVVPGEGTVQAVHAHLWSLVQARLS